MIPSRRQHLRLGFIFPALRHVQMEVSLGLSLVAPISQNSNWDELCHFCKISKVPLQGRCQFCVRAICNDRLQQGCSQNKQNGRSQTTARTSVGQRKCQRHSCGSQIRTHNVKRHCLSHISCFMWFTNPNRHKQRHTHCTTLSKTQMTLLELANSVISFSFFVFGPNSSPWALAVVAADETWEKCKMLVELGLPTSDWLLIWTRCGRRVLRKLEALNCLWIELRH